MNHRERVKQILHYGKADRMPAVHFGYWDELLVEWAEQGHIPADLARGLWDGNEKDRELDKIIGWDFNWYTTTSGSIRLDPAFPRVVLEELPDGFLRVQNPEGLIERVRPGASSIPAEDDYQLKDREAFEKLYLPKMQWKEERINRAHFEKLKAEDSIRENPLGLHLGSVFGEIRNMLSVIGMSYLMCDDYDLLVDIVDTYAELQFKCAEESLKIYSGYDFAHYWEDICFTNGPLLSPMMFEELCAKHYKKRNELVRDYGIDVISLDCDGVTKALLPTWFENGVNTMFPIEIGTWGDQFAPARDTFGKGMLGVGGMDKTAFRKDKAAVDQELSRMAKLAKMGGFIPCPDHRIMPGSKFELVKYYAEEIKKIQL
ncbi:MAG: hypothetical protein E7363_04440 [Clostridiales bacterium]|nr:hypothetical protein [Clostridiales bacterium]